LGFMKKSSKKSKAHLVTGQLSLVDVNDKSALEINYAEHESRNCSLEVKVDGKRLNFSELHQLASALEKKEKFVRIMRQRYASMASALTLLDEDQFKDKD
jgi:hypothetical protein